jgi:signal peptidase II
MVILLVIADQLIKLLAINFFPYQLNSGIAFGLGKDSNLLWLAVSVILLIIINRRSWLIVSGGISNCLDRFWRGGVVDYLNFWIFPKFNLADCLILAGCLRLMYSFGYETVKRYLRG